MVISLKKYKDNLEQYMEANKSYFLTYDKDLIEFNFERINTISSQKIEDLISWYEREKERCDMKYEHIPLQECKGWSIDTITGSLVHKSGEFFRVDGIRVQNSNEREVSGGWEQPIITQVGFDGGILGLIRKRIYGVPHYLVEAKSEPGNPGIVQISTTVQATFSNLKQAHGGSKTKYSEYFIHPDENDAKILFSRWMSEDGGRLLNKRNKSMVVEVEKDIDIEDTRYRWVTLHDLVVLTREKDAIVAPHIRGILAAL